MLMLASPSQLCHYQAVISSEIVIVSADGSWWCVLPLFFVPAQKKISICYSLLSFTSALTAGL